MTLIYWDKMAEKLLGQNILSGQLFLVSQESALRIKQA